jgi:hypothetical protein
MIKAVVLYHPQSKILLNDSAFESELVSQIGISCGTTKVPGAKLSESADFHPSYASWNSCLFETSVILTVWEHADSLIGEDNVAILHSDIVPNQEPEFIWQTLDNELRDSPKRSIGLTIPVSLRGYFKDWLMPDSFPMTVSKDPMKAHAFDNNIHVWDYIKKYDPDIYQWAMDVEPSMIYSHQFACSRETFDYLGNKLFNVVQRLRLTDVGFWTPHMFERLISLYLSCKEPPLLTTAFWHYSSSSAFGPGEQVLYGIRPFRYYRTISRANQF